MKMFQFNDCWYFVDEFKTLWKLIPEHIPSLPFTISKHSYLSDNNYNDLMSGKIDITYFL